MPLNHVGGRLLLLFITYYFILSLHIKWYGVWPFSIDFSDNFGGSTKKMHVGGGQETIILQVMALYNVLLIMRCNFGLLAWQYQRYSKVC